MQSKTFGEVAGTQGKRAAFPEQPGTLFIQDNLIAVDDLECPVETFMADIVFGYGSPQGQLCVVAKTLWFNLYPICLPGDFVPDEEIGCVSPVAIPGTVGGLQRPGVEENRYGATQELKILFNGDGIFQFKEGVEATTPAAESRCLVFIKR